MAPTSFGDLPFEVQEMIGPFLRPHDLSICVRVCRTWKTVFNPFLWSHVAEPEQPEPVSPNAPNWTDVFLRCAKNFALRNNGDLIQSFKFDFCDDDLSEFLEHSAFDYPILRSAEFDGLEGDDESIAEFIEMSTAGWKRLVFRLDDSDCVLDFGVASVIALLEHADTLEIFRVEAASELASMDIKELLCSAPKLKELYVLARDRRDDGESCSLDVTDIVKSKWVCKSLEVFGCQIGRIPRPDITREICGEPAAESHLIRRSTSKTSIRLQRKVFAQFARLTKLRQLSLGVPIDTMNYGYLPSDKEWYRRYDCLAFTLESGLDLLKDLKALRVVELDDMEVYIDGDAEQAWIAEHWPSVKIGCTDYTTDMDFFSDPDMGGGYYDFDTYDDFEEEDVWDDEE
ncbi:hypothetical protein BGX23_008168 [Mortierella sp. AD031]|nr:hypothetical protein BGX23_008168 [Mortierella sp. AD031]KAG0206107.1 hypothetical protein BGX33_007580 [Mortierella sp. NVP41]